MKLIGISLVGGLLLLVGYYFMSLPDPANAERDKLIHILNLKICLPICSPFGVLQYEPAYDSCRCDMSVARKKFEYEQESFSEPSRQSVYPRDI